MLYWNSFFNEKPQLEMILIIPSPYNSPYNKVFSLTVYHMQETGWIKVSQEDVGDLYHRFAAEKK